MHSDLVNAGSFSRQDVTFVVLKRVIIMELYMNVRYIIEITENGTAAKPINYLTDMIKEVMTSTAELYMSVGIYAALDWLPGDRRK